MTDAIAVAGYPTDEADPAAINMPLLILVLTYLAVLVTMVYGPIAAALVELFPTRIRYSGVSLPYHIGNGWFGGLAAADRRSLRWRRPATSMPGLWYPIIIAAMTFVIGLVFLPETKDRDIRDIRG